MLFGLRKVSDTFQRGVEVIFSSANRRYTLFYLGDTVIFSRFYKDTSAMSAKFWNSSAPQLFRLS